MVRLALRGGTWPKPLAYLGIGVTITAWLAAVGQELQFRVYRPLSRVHFFEFEAFSLFGSPRQGNDLPEIFREFI